MQLVEKEDKGTDRLDGHPLRKYLVYKGTEKFPARARASIFPSHAGPIIW